MRYTTTPRRGHIDGKADHLTCGRQVRSATGIRLERHAEVRAGRGWLATNYMVDGAKDTHLTTVDTTTTTAMRWTDDGPYGDER
eukprot:COSAG06_NODE_27180_length_598_cov_66.865731_1_plen_83_part_10